MRVLSQIIFLFASLAAASCGAPTLDSVHESDSALGTNIAHGGTGYRWYNNSSSTGTLNQVAAAWVNDHINATQWVGNKGNNHDGSWEGIGVIWQSTQTISSVTFRNGANTNGTHNCFFDVAGTLRLQQTVDGTTWTNVSGCTAAPAYPYGISACSSSGVNYTFHCPLSSVRGVRVFGQVGVKTSWDVTAMELIAKGSQSCTPSCANKKCGDDGCGGSCGTCPSGQICTASGACLTSEDQTPPAPIFGVTIDDVSNLSGIRDSLASLARKPTARIVFDDLASSYYADAVKNLHQVAYIMGQPYDSSAQDCTASAAAARMNDYLGNSTLLHNVDIWEVGNEVNGEWICGNNTSATYKAVRAIYDAVKAKGKPTALTLFWYDSSCAPTPRNEMFNWVNQHVSQDMRLGLDYVFISVYETACPPPDSWTPIFEQLATLFPNSKIGFGETGTENQQAPLRTKLAILNKYYGLAPMHPRFVGGDFWWYFAEDMVPKTATLWTELNKYANNWNTLYP